MEGSVLVDAQWHQHCPYNNDCIFLGCTNTCDPYNYSALAGCGAIAASQVMHYWCYPPSPEGGDEYDWRHMPNDATLNSSEVEQAAVAELCHEAGAAAESTYGCDGTSSINAYWEDVFESDYYYADCQYIDRIDYPTPLWELLIQTEINNNRPISYFVVEHDIVCDGWLTTESNTYYHMNYGWNNPFTWWYLLDALWLGNPDEENMYIGVVPVNHLGPALSGTYLLTSGLPRYFDVDASGSEAVFLPGNLLQTLPGINIKGTGTSTDVAFTGVSGITTKFFTAGYQANGIHIHNGAIHLRNNGSIRLQKAY